MLLHRIREQILLNGCAVLHVDQLSEAWPARHPFSWDVESATQWCERNRISMDVDAITGKVYFGPAGVYVPAIA